MSGRDDQPRKSEDKDMNRIVSLVPGRIRLRDKQLRNPEALDRLSLALSAMPAITALQGSVRTGGLLLHYDARAVAREDMERQVEAAAEQTLGTARPEQALQLKKEINRYNKLAMLGSLGASLTFAAKRGKGWKRGHVWTSYLFVANLGVHLFIYRKSLFRLFR